MNAKARINRLHSPKQQGLGVLLWGEGMVTGSSVSAFGAKHCPRPSLLPHSLTPTLGAPLSLNAHNALPQVESPPWT